MVRSTWNYRVVDLPYSDGTPSMAILPVYYIDGVPVKVGWDWEGRLRVEHEEGGEDWKTLLAEELAQMRAALDLPPVVQRDLPSGYKLTNMIEYDPHPVEGGTR